VEKYPSVLLYYLVEKPEAVVNLFGFIFTAMTFAYAIRRERRQRQDISEKDRKLQHRRNYLNLELEASRIFQVCVENPEVPLYLKGDLSPVPNSHVAERCYWFICQTLNVFEIIISFRKEEMVEDRLFATWISWFHELGTSERFADYWIGQTLCAHYKPELQQIMDEALRLRRQRPAEFDNNTELQLKELEAFHRQAARILQDSSIDRHFDDSMSRNRTRLLGTAEAVAVPS
jgi:hypothetical protein